MKYIFFITKSTNIKKSLIPYDSLKGSSSKVFTNFTSNEVAECVKLKETLMMSSLYYEFPHKLENPSKVFLVVECKTLPSIIKFTFSFSQESILYSV